MQSGDPGVCGKGKSVVSAWTCNSLSAWLDVSPPAMTARGQMLFFDKASQDRPQQAAEAMAAAGNAVDIAAAIGGWT